MVIKIGMMWINTVKPEYLMKTIKITDQLSLNKIGPTTDDRVFLTVDSNGALELSTYTGQDGGLTVKGALSVTHLEGDLDVDGGITAPILDEIKDEMFGDTTIAIADAAYTLSAAEANSANLLITGAKTAETYYVVNAAINNAGTGYTAGDILTIVGGTNTTVAKIKVDTVGGGGAITGVVVETDVVGDEGDYTVRPANPVSVTGGTGTSATFDLEWFYRGVEMIVDVADSPIDVNVYSLFDQINYGYIVARMSTQLYRQGVQLYQFQFRNLVHNSGTFCDNKLKEYSPETGGINDFVTVNLLEDADFTVPFDAAKCYHVRFTDDANVLTAPRSMSAQTPAFHYSNPSVQFIENATAFNLTYKYGGGTGVVIEAGKTRMIYLDVHDLDYLKLPLYIQDDTTPKLGGNLDVNGFDIVSSSNGDIELDPNGSGKILLTAETKLGGDLDVNGNDITTTVSNGDITITPNGSGDITLDGTSWDTTRTTIADHTTNLRENASVDMSSADYTLTAAQAKNSVLVLSNTGDGTKILTIPDEATNPTHYTIIIPDGSNPVKVVVNGETTTSAAYAGVNQFCRIDGTGIRRTDAVFCVYTTDGGTGSTATSENILEQFIIPEGGLKVGDTLVITLSIKRSATATDGTLKVKMGKLGTTSDAEVWANTQLTSVSAAYGLTAQIHLLVLSATTVVAVSTRNGTNPFATTTSSSSHSIVTIDDITTDPVYLSFIEYANTNADTYTSKYFHGAIHK